jgi:hypothetical protein
MEEQTIQVIAAVLFGVALLHTFATRLLHKLASRFPRHAGLFHLLGEVEVVFGFWAMVLVVTMAVVAGPAQALGYAESRQYTEPLFVFVIMVVAASRPVLVFVRGATGLLARRLPVRTELAEIWLGLALVPLVGSLITEPAAMTLAALMLAPMVFRPGIPEWKKYAALGVLFVNISIGGTLTSYAAPPVLMVASTWDWDTAFMAREFGWKAALAVAMNATGVVLLLAGDVRARPADGGEDTRRRMPAGIVLIHLAFLAGVVVSAHRPVVFLSLFMFFLGFTQAYARHNDPLVLKEGLLVGFFLAGLVVLGGMQQWWLQPIVSGLAPLALFFSALGLTALTDNAALTYLGSLIPDLSPERRYMLVAGAVAGGGLTVIANAPNPAGVALLKRGFADESIGALGLLLGALLPTAIAAAAFLFL